jgi:hypothetical protein
MWGLQEVPLPGGGLWRRELVKLANFVKAFHLSTQGRLWYTNDKSFKFAL